MPPLTYHEGHLAVQAEAQTVEVADRLADWVGPATQFALEGDLFVLASGDAGDGLRFLVASGTPPLVEIAGEDPVALRFIDSLAPNLPNGPCGGLVISMATARRARMNGMISNDVDGATLTTTETFTLCRKYVSPSIAHAEKPFLGPEAREEIGLGDDRLGALVSSAETAFLASVSPDGNPDVSHRGGPPGFIDFNSEAGKITWSEFVGDGILKSAGNLRTTGTFALLIPDFDIGNGVELVGVADYTNTRPERRPRTDALVKHRDPFPEQGYIEGRVLGAFVLNGLLHTRERIEKQRRITSASEVSDQAPQ